MAVGGGAASVTLPAQSIGMLVVPLSGGSGPDAGTPDAGAPDAGAGPDAGSSGPDGGTGTPDAGSPPGTGDNPADDPLSGVSGSCNASGTRPSAELPLLLLVAALALAIGARGRR